MMTKQTVYIIDDDSSIRDALTQVLQTMGWEIKCYADSFSFMQEALFEHPSCILLDIRMPGKSGITILEELKRLTLEVPIIIMTGHGNIELCRQAFQNGAKDFLTKPIDANVLIDTINKAMAEHLLYLQKQQNLLSLQNRFSLLSNREQEVLMQLIRGSSNKVIAKELCLSPRTIEAHRANILTKLQVGSITQLTCKYAAILDILKESIT